MVDSLQFQLDDLNSAQKEAVLQTEGPLLIIAGAGTGKTHVLTSRILHLLFNKRIPAEQILALTFSEKAAQEMQERLDRVLPLSYDEITLKTFHGFCENVLRERGPEIGIDPAYKILNFTDQWLFLRKNLFALELDYYRPLGNPSKFFSSLLHYFSRLKDEDIAPDTYFQYAEKIRLKALDPVTQESAIKHLELAKAYRVYDQLLTQQGFLDFGGLQYFCLRLLENHPSVLDEYQERFRYIVVDEFQDTNYAQNKLVTLLSRKYKNITVMGDDDQAIYKWRGASLSNILNFEKTFPESKKIVLTRNYRSTQKILDLTYAVIQNNNPYRLEIQEKIDKKLFSEQVSGKPVEIWHFPRYFDESRAIAQKIQNTLEASQGKLRYRDFAILVRTHKLQQPFIQALQEAHIPCMVKNSEGLVKFNEIKDFIALIRFLKNPDDDVAFFRLLTLDNFELAMVDILDMVAKAKAAGHVPLFKFLRESLKENKVQGTLPGLENVDLSPLEQVAIFFNQLLDFSKNTNISLILGEFLEKTGYLKNLTDHETSENNEKIQRISQFSEIIHSFEMENKEKSLSAFLEYIELLEESESNIVLLPQEEEDAVSILTFHGAKGLEFHTVFMPSLVGLRFPGIHRREVLEIPTELVEEELPDQDQHLQEERRLFYVGCTRACKELILSYSDFYEGTRRWKASIFLEEARRSGTVLEIDFNQPSGILKSNPNLSQKKLGQSEMLEERFAFIPKINVNRLSYSQLDTFATCPLKYKYRYLFKIPSPSVHAANFGSSIHDALHGFYAQLKKGHEPNRILLSEQYEKHWIPSGYESKAHEQTRKQQGRKMLERFYEKESSPRFLIPTYLEKNFRLKIGEFTFTGRIDRIDKLADGTYEVIDYKTGHPKREEELKGDLQLSLYALACKEIFHLRVSKLSLYFLEDMSKASSKRTEEDLKRVKQELQTLSRELVQSDFSPTPGFHCQFCEFRILCQAAH